MKVMVMVEDGGCDDGAMKVKIWSGNEGDGIRWVLAESPVGGRDYCEPPQSPPHLSPDTVCFQT